MVFACCMTWTELNWASWTEQVQKKKENVPLKVEFLSLWLLFHTSYYTLLLHWKPHKTAAVECLHLLSNWDGGGYFGGWGCVVCITLCLSLFSFFSHISKCKPVIQQSQGKYAILFKVQSIQRGDVCLFWGLYTIIHKRIKSHSLTQLRMRYLDLNGLFMWGPEQLVWLMALMVSDPDL